MQIGRYLYIYYYNTIVIYRLHDKSPHPEFSELTIGYGIQFFFSVLKHVKSIENGKINNVC